MTNKAINIIITSVDCETNRAGLTAGIAMMLESAGATNVKVTSTKNELVNLNEENIAEALLSIGDGITINIIDGGDSTTYKDYAVRSDIHPSFMENIEYLRSRNRWTQKLEDDLIKLCKAGTPPNMMEYGVTKETQTAIITLANEQLNKRN